LFCFGTSVHFLSSAKRQNYRHRGQFMKIEDKLNLSEDRGQISKIEDSPLKNQADGQPTFVGLLDPDLLESTFLPK